MFSLYAGPAPTSPAAGRDIAPRKARRVGMVAPPSAGLLLEASESFPRLLQRAFEPAEPLLQVLDPVHILRALPALPIRSTRGHLGQPLRKLADRLRALGIAVFAP